MPGKKTTKDFTNRHASENGGVHVCGLLGLVCRSRDSTPLSRGPRYIDMVAVLHSTLARSVNGLMVCCG